MSTIKSIFILLFFQVTIYTLSVYSWRLIGERNLRGAVVIDAIYAATQFFMIRKVSSGTKPYLDLVGYVIGAMIGTVIGMLIDTSRI